MKRLLVLPLLLAVLAPAPTGYHAMVATEQRLASQVGLDVLRSGGNAVDAAVAVGYALAVVDPCCGNLGGGGFMLIRMHDGRERFIDFREKAPLRATRDMYLDAHGNVVPGRSVKGWLAAGVPGTVMGLERARTQYGTMSRARLLAPAIALARGGYMLTRSDLQPFAVGRRRIYVRGGMDAARNGRASASASCSRSWRTRSNQSRQAVRTRSIAAGSRVRSCRRARRGGGILSMRDFAGYDVAESAPLHCAYGGLEIVSAPPPSSGGVTLCEILHIVAPYPIAAYGWHSVRETHVVVEAERRAYADRNAYLGDPAFVRNPVAQLLSPAYAQQRRATILPRDATPSSSRSILACISTCTRATIRRIIRSSMRTGNAVAVTYTINDWFGAGVAAPQTGFWMNDEMDDFTSKPGVPNLYGLVQGKANAIAPGKRPLSSMAPTIVLRDGKLAMVTGSPGGSRIITITLETLLNHFAFGMNAQQAVDAPRIHMQWLPDVVEYEPGAFSVGVESDAAAARIPFQSDSIVGIWPSDRRRSEDRGAARRIGSSASGRGSAWVLGLSAGIGWRNGKGVAQRRRFAGVRAVVLPLAVAKGDAPGRGARATFGSDHRRRGRCGLARRFRFGTPALEVDHGQHAVRCALARDALGDAWTAGANCARASAERSSTGTCFRSSTSAVRSQVPSPPARMRRRSRVPSGNSSKCVKRCDTRKE